MQIQFSFIFLTLKRKCNKKYEYYCILAQTLRYKKHNLKITNIQKFSEILYHEERKRIFNIPKGMEKDIRKIYIKKYFKINHVITF